MALDEFVVWQTDAFVGFEGFEAHSVRFVVGGYGGDEVAGGEDVEGGEDEAVDL
jgi:hypothetical protein